jgi:hypothetical protein
MSTEKFDSNENRQERVENVKELGLKVDDVITFNYPALSEDEALVDGIIGNAIDVNLATGEQKVSRQTEYKIVGIEKHVEFDGGGIFELEEAIFALGVLRSAAKDLEYYSKKGDQKMMDACIKVLEKSAKDMRREAEKRRKNPDSYQKGRISFAKMLELQDHLTKINYIER